MGDSEDDDRDGKMKIIVVVLCSLILVAMVVAVVTVGHSRSVEDKKEDAKPDTGVKANAKAVQAICQTTDYKDACQQSLASTNSTDLKELVGIAFAAAKKTILEASKSSSVIIEGQKDPRTKDAIASCQDLATTAADDLDRSFTQMSKMELVQVDDILENLKSWLSGALTYQETCLDGFENTTGDAGQKMKKVLALGMQLTNNALAMVTEICTALSSAGMGESKRRRLLSNIQKNEGYPSWVEPQAKRLLLERGRPIKTNLVVAKDGSGKFTTISEALLSIPRNSDKVFVLHIKEGVYKEKVQVDRNLTKLMMIGDGPTKTRITGSLNFIDGVGTFQTATVAVLGDNFIGAGIGFENSAGAEKHQAVALRVGADLSIFYNCHMDGYQDTLYAHTYRQFYRNCQISGTIDFIFGDSTALFQNCTMLVRKPMDNQANIVTAQGRKISRQPTGIVLQNCSIVADPALYPVRKTLKSYLARPWKEYSRTIIMESFIDDLIAPEGFLPWNGTFALDTLYYTEYNNYGPGSDKGSRLKWVGIKELNRTEIKQFSANKFLGGEIWVRPRRVPLHSESNKTNYIPYDSWFTRAAPKDGETGSDSSSSPSESTSKSPSPASSSPSSSSSSTSSPSPSSSSSPEESNKKSPSSSPNPTSSSSSSSSPEGSNEQSPSSSPEGSSSSGPGPSSSDS